MIRSIYSVTIYVPNQNEAIRFYKEMLGFEVRRWEPLGPAGSWIEMGPPGQETALVLYPQQMMPDYKNRRAFIMLNVDDVAAKYEELTNRGVASVQEPTSLGWGTFALMADPFGNEFGLMQVTRPPSAMPRQRMGSAPPPPPPKR
jgi:lactoylglutathione lyase